MATTSQASRKPLRPSLTREIVAVKRLRRALLTVRMLRNHLNALGGLTAAERREATRCADDLLGDMADELAIAIREAP